MQKIIKYIITTTLLFTTVAIHGVTLKALLIADTNDASIGTSVKTDLENMKRELKLIAKNASMQLDMRTMQTHRKSLLAKVNTSRHPKLITLQ